jgi:hypothetical protein
MDLREIGWEGVDRIHLVPVVCCCEDGYETLGSIKGWDVLDYMSDY